MFERSLIKPLLIIALLGCGVSVQADRKEDLVNPIPYVVTKPAGYIDSPIDPKTVYEYKRRGTVDAEPMSEVKPYLIPEKQLPPPTVIPHSGAGPVEQVVSAQKPIPKAVGEDRVFQQIAYDQLKVQCLMDDTLDQCEGIEIDVSQPDPKPRSKRIIDRQLQSQPAGN